MKGIDKYEQIKHEYEWDNGVPMRPCSKPSELEEFATYTMAPAIATYTMAPALAKDRWTWWRAMLGLVLVYAAKGAISVTYIAAFYGLTASYGAYGIIMTGVFGFSIIPALIWLDKQLDNFNAIIEATK